MTMTLSEQLAAADAAAAPLAAHVAALETELRTAVDTGDFGRAHDLQAELTAARDNAVVAGAAVAALREGAEAVGRAHAADAQRLTVAQQRAKAADDLADAMAAEQASMTDLDNALARMWASIAAAKRDLLAALALEQSVGEARMRAAFARDAASDSPTGMPPKAPRPNKASVLAEQDQLIGALARWSR